MLLLDTVTSWEKAFSRTFLGPSHTVGDTDISNLALSYAASMT